MFMLFKEMREQGETFNGKMLKEFIEKGNLSEKEAEKVLMLQIYSIDDYSDTRKREADLKEIFTSWFRKELKEAQKVRENIMVNIKLKRLESELYADLSFQDTLGKYEQFKNILSGNQIL